MEISEPYIPQDKFYRHPDEKDYRIALIQAQYDKLKSKARNGKFGEDGVNELRKIIDKFVETNPAVKTDRDCLITKLNAVELMLGLEKTTI